MKLVEKRILLDLHQPSWAAYRLTLVYSTAFLAIVPGTGWAIATERYALLAPLVFAQVFVMHAFLIAFHEAAHGALCPLEALNGFVGRLTGLFSFMSLTLYRAAHHWHHAYIGDVRDEEFWPLNDPDAARWKRRLAAFLELFCGLLWTPFLFLRSFLRRDSVIRERAIRRLIWAELFASAAFAGAVIFAVVWFDVVLAFLAGFLIPAYLAGNVQSWRKYAEHVGLTGKRAVALTRSVRNPSRIGRLLSWSLFQEPYHDVHHLYPKVPQESLPTVAAAENPIPPELPVFPSYTAAFRDLLRGLSDPKFGKAWVK